MSMTSLNILYPSPSTNVNDGVLQGADSLAGALPKLRDFLSSGAWWLETRLA